MKKLEAVLGGLGLAVVASGPTSATFVPLSLLAWFLILAGIPINLTALDRQDGIWSLVEPVYGLVQRALFATWFSWCALLGMLLVGVCRVRWPRA